ncbi:hypothetical protein HZS61_003022 [Fusarium oxysporum f. sp. conglutinans]|nr:hypothetical protein HZS61_003022 [Fusarium oxysporum f. sp. conglutinans]
MERRDFELPDPDWMRDLSHCPLSDRDKELLEKFWTELENDRMEHCARCQETWFDMGLKGGICKRCIARDKNKKEDEPWFFSAENQLDFGLIPAFLPQLTIVEEMLIARVHVFVNVMQVRGQQYKYRGHIVHFLRDVGKVYSQLPLLPPELDVILLRPPTASEHAHLNRQFRRQFRVRRRCLQEWLNFLSNNHPGYRGITVCQKRMSVLPEDGDVLDQVATAAVTDPLSANLGNIENDDVEPDEVDQSAVPDLLPEDTEMEALRSHVLGEERGEHLPVRPSTQHQLEMPDIRRTPINEFNHSQALLSLAFPTLFPRGQADFVEPRLRPIKYADYIQHALRWHDGRFARHPTFRFVVFNTLMRAQARAKSSYFVKEYQQRQGLITRDDLLEAFQNPESAEAQQLLNSINRQTAQLRGTRPYWYRKRRELESYAYNLDCPGAFITFSPADLHWRSLYQHLPQFQDWQELPEQQRMGMSSKLLRDNPHIAAWHFYRRFGLFRDIVLKQKFNVTDYWNRYEWQGRGSSHCHGLFWMDGAPSVDLENEHLRKEFARIWRFHVTAFNPEPARVRQQGEGNPLAVNPLQHPLTFQWLSQVLNRCQRHHCSETYCLRKKKGSEEISCRFFFPRDTRDTADVVRRQGQSYFSFEAARNDSLMNHYNRCLSLGWLANIDISPCTSLQAVINYAAKYCSKMEKRTDSYASMGRQILPYVSHQNPLLSFASRLMNKLLTERDFSGQEICHVLLNCELQEGTRVIRAVDCRPYEQQGRSLRLQGPSIASQEGVRLGTPIESPVSSPSIWPRPARERHSRPPVQLQQSAIERPVMERRDFELPDPDWMRDLSHCPLSDRDKELLEKFWTELENDRMEHCARCQETWFDMGLKGGICKRCIARDKNKKEDEPWFFSAENQLDFGLIPAFLPQLTIVEEMLIARVHVFVNVMQVRGQQYKYRGHIVHFLRDVGKVYSQLPLLPPELDVILLRPPTASEHAHLNRQFRRQFRVRRRCLQEWLNFLSNNHPGYRGITVCQKRMSVLPEDGDVLDQVATAAVTDPLSANLGNIENDDVEPDEVDQSAVPDLLPEDTEMEALRSHVLGEERGEHLPVRPSTQHQLEMPDIRRTPINEFNHSQALLSLAFPTLFPRGQADFVEPRLRPIKYADYIQHALRWHDGRFARHPTFRFVVFNTLMRAQARAKSSYFVKEYQQRQGLITRDDLLEAFQNPESAEAQQLLNSINRQTAQLRGTRPYWYRKRRELESYAYNLDCPGAFITFSPADLHWRSLYQHLPQFQDWQELPEQQRMGMSSKLLRDNPHIAAWHFYRRFGLFRDIVLKQKFNVTDYWNRYEWQGRGSSHCHGLFWMDGAPSVDLENEHLRKEFARIWRFHVTAFNPEPARVRQQGEGNPLAVNPLQHPLTFQWLSQVLNRCQRHHCSETYCLRKKKGSEEISCRFFFPRDTRDTADVVRRQGQSYFSFEAARNDSLMNHYNRCLSLGWLANIDISPCTSLQAVINYAAKYCSKMEKRTDSYASMGRQILPYVSHQNPLLSFASRLMNKLLTERDFSGQEICHVLLNCELQEGTRVIRAVDCRPYEQQGRSLRLQGDHDDAEVVGIYEKYLSRPPLHEELTYLDFLANWNTSKRDGRKWTRWSRQAKPRVLYYFPRYKSNHQHHQYDDFCRVKLMLAHPHRDPNELRKINGVEYNSYASAAEFCYGNHRHPDDYYGTPNAEERRPDPDEFEEEFHEPDLLEEDWLELARQLPDCPPSQEAIDLLGRRDIDIQYDWTPHVGRYADPGIVQGDYWRQRIEQNRLYMDVEDMPLEVRDALNPEQRIVYDTFIGHFQCGSEEQILLHVDGGGGTGKSYMIKVLSSHLQRLAGNRPSPIWRAAPTGVASNQIMGTTLHSLLRLPMDRAFTELSPADANAIQKKLRDVRYLVIDEKSMLGLRQLSWIDKRLRQVFPARAAEFFGGISIILVGDFFQLPPIANKPLYFDGPLKDLHEVSGQTAYRAFNHTVFLKKVQRQQGDDQAGFRLALEELRGLKLSIESWKLLSQRVQVKLSQREEDTFDAALRIYSKKARVNEYNYEHLVRLKHPAIQVMAKNIGNGADKATSEQAGNLAGQFPPAGLVNGAQGTVYDIGWAPGADAHRDPPSVIMMINGVEYNSYASAAEFCYGNHRHPDDYYGTPNAEERRPDPDEFEEEFHEPDLLEEDWLELARQLPDCPPSQEAIDLLGRRDIDIQYDWTPHVGRYADPGIVQGDYWRQRIEQNRLYMDVEDMPLEVRDALNPEQRIVYDTFIGHFQCGSEEQILLHVDGGGGTGKSYMIKVLSSHLQRLAGNRPSPIWRAAPTGVASNQIMGTTLHSLLRLPMDRAFTELSPADANAIQKKLRDVRYLVIDEKSMLGLRQLSWIDKRLRQVFPARAAEFFGGISIILVGDFFQLPPIANKPLYFDGPLKDLHEVSGQTAYRAFNHTVFLKKVQRQQGDDQAGFRLALEELRGLKLSIESWKLLSQRVQVKLSQREEDTFDAALRIYSKKARVNEYNYEHLVRLKHPAIQVMAKNIGNGADKATSEQAGNLAGQFPPAGLVNGAQGTVYDIGWAPGADAHRDPPSVIMMVMDKYTGPSYLTTDDGREVVPILPVKRDFFLGTSACTRKQFPLMASYAITVHKSQSITVDKMVTDLSERDFQTGLSYVAVSRVKMLDGLMIDAPFERASLHYEKLPDGKHSSIMLFTLEALYVLTD